MTGALASVKNSVVPAGGGRILIPPPKARERTAAVCGAPAAAARRGQAFSDNSATLGIRTCCGWSFGHSRDRVVVPRCAPLAAWPQKAVAFNVRPWQTLHHASFSTEFPRGILVQSRGWSLSWVAPGEM